MEFPMKGIFLVLSFVVLCGLFSCSQSEKSKAVVQVIEKSDSCQQDTKHTYDVYIPERNYTEDKLPLLVIIDAHGSGKFALEKFKSGADQYPAVLVASNLVKNGFSNYVKAIQTLVDDVRQKYPVSETVFLSGFSGGARMALGYALSHPVNGLIMCGALAGADQINVLHCPVFSISGTDDFNFVETAQYLFQEQSIPGNLKIELINASHNWPDSLMLSNALGFLYLSNRSPKSGIKDYSQLQHQRIEQLKEKGEFLKAGLIARNMSTTAPFSSDKSFASEYSDLKGGVAYKSRLKKLEDALKFEMKVRQPYMEALTTKDSLWWKNEIQSINKKLDTEQDSFIIDMYRRIKAFWGIACYSLGNQAIQAKKTVELGKILTVYKMLEPQNPDMMYFSAFPYFWKGDNEATLLQLRKACASGFSDMGRLKQDFPESITAALN